MRVGEGSGSSAAIEGPGELLALRLQMGAWSNRMSDVQTQDGNKRTSTQAGKGFSMDCHMSSWDIVLAVQGGGACRRLE